jgi:hypothetical protein
VEERSGWRDRASIYGLLSHVMDEEGAWSSNLEKGH